MSVAQTAGNVIGKAASGDIGGAAADLIAGIGGGSNADPALQGYLDAAAANRAQTFKDMIVFLREDRLNENLRAAIARIKTAAQIQR